MAHGIEADNWKDSKLQASTKSQGDEEKGIRHTTPLTCGQGSTSHAPMLSFQETVHSPYQETEVLCLWEIWSHGQDVQKPREKDVSINPTHPPEDSTSGNELVGSSHTSY